MSNTSRHPNVINADEVSPRDMRRGKHNLHLRRLGGPAGSKALGAILTEIPPGAVSFPFHYHSGIEEAIYVVSGTGTSRIGEQRVPIRAGDWIACPPGPEHAHQMINDSDAPLVYLCVSTMALADVVVYPDSKKVAATAGEWMSPWHASWLQKVLRSTTGKANRLPRSTNKPNWTVATGSRPR
jgi:uncharacterized cupin superfamily protein